jgi:hypothetical protein
VLAELGIADRLAAGSRSAADLAAETHCHAPSLYRILRAAAGLDLLHEEAEQRFVLTPLGTTLRSDAPGHARSTVRLLAGPIYWAGYGEILHSLRTGETAMEKLHGANLFEYLAGRPDDARCFNETMIGVHGAEPAAIASAYDFPGMRRLVDVGGGTGNLLATILAVHPHLRGVLFDRPLVVAEARKRLASHAGNVMDRCELQSGDFFQCVPPSGDAYLLSHIIHDWDEPRCLQILDRCRQAMSPNGGCLLLAEMILPERNQVNPGLLIDFIMLTMTGGVERTREEYAALLRRAGFRMTRVVPTSSAVSVIEARPA